MKSPAEQCRFLPEACRVGRMQDRILHCNKDCDYVAIPVRHVRSRCAFVSGSQVLPSKSCQTDFDMPLHREGASTTDSGKKEVGQACITRGVGFVVITDGRPWNNDPAKPPRRKDLEMFAAEETGAGQDLVSCPWPRTARRG